MLHPYGLYPAHLESFRTLCPFRHPFFSVAALIRKAHRMEDGPDNTNSCFSVSAKSTFLGFLSFTSSCFQFTLGAFVPFVFFFFASVVTRAIFPRFLRDVHERPASVETNNIGRPRISRGDFHLRLQYVRAYFAYDWT